MVQKIPFIKVLNSNFLGSELKGVKKYVEIGIFWVAV